MHVLSRQDFQDEEGADGSSHDGEDEGGRAVRRLPQWQDRGGRQDPIPRVRHSQLHEMSQVVIDKEASPMTAARLLTLAAVMGDASPMTAARLLTLASMVL